MPATAYRLGLKFIVLCIPTLAAAETVELRSGGVLLGDVRLDGEAIVVDARYPRVETVRLKREDVAPESLFAIVERRADAKDAPARVRLGELAESLDLKAAAVAEYRAAATLDPGVAKEMEARVARLGEAIAADLLEAAQQLLDEGRPRAACMYLHTLLELHPATRAAGRARTLMSKAHQEAGNAVDVAKKTVPEDRAESTIAEVESHLSNADAALREVGGHEGTVADQRAAERAIHHYEAAWEKAKTLPVAASDQALARRIEEIRARAKTGLVEAYLTAGSVHLQRRSIPAAEDYCNKACELDPERKQTHALHRLIIEAKSVYPGWAFGRGAR